MDENAVFDLEDIHYAYPDGACALDGVSLRVLQGDAVALIGANGSGKSTLLKVLDALIFPSRGSFKAFGQLITEASMLREAFAFAFRRRVGFVFQNSDAQLFSATVLDEVLFGPLHLGQGTTEASDRALDTLDWLGIYHLKYRAPHSLSGGEKKKVALASVLVLDPETLLLDEPSNSLDPRSQVWLIETLLSLRDLGKTIVIATHSLALVPELATRAVVVGEDHRIATSGAVCDVLANEDLLLSVNLVHEHEHSHKGFTHTHPHAHHDDHTAEP